MSPERPISFTEADIRPPEMMADKQRLVDADRDFLLKRRSEWVLTACPSCEGTASRPYGEKAGFAFVECAACRTVYTNPRPGADLLAAFYAQSQNYAYWNKHIFPASEKVRRERIFRPRAARVKDACGRLGIRSGTLLEIGAGFGTFCEEMRDHGIFDRIVALEPTPDLAQTCRSKGFEVLEMPVERVTRTGFVDVLAAFEVIEHLFSPRDFVARCARLLAPGGLLVLSCPNIRGFDVAALGVLSGTFNHEHVNYFHPASLAALLERAGLGVLEVQTPGKLDAELVRKQALSGALDLRQQPFLREALVDRWEELGAAFQDFLSAHRLSSHMWVIARKGSVRGDASR